jgi:type VI secretion system protein ImpL
MAAPAKFFSLRWFLTLIGVILVCLLIWFAGPYLAFADAKPFASVVGRLIAILVVLFIWALVSQWRLWRASRATNELAAAAGAPEPAERSARGGAVSGADSQLAVRFRKRSGHCVSRSRARVFSNCRGT